MLSVTVPADAAIGLLDPDITQTVTDLLAEIPTGIEMHTVNPSDYEALLGPDSPAWKLWDVLRRNDPDDAKWGIGATTASKIMHRKRPHLIPIWVDVIDQLLGKPRPKTSGRDTSTPIRPGSSCESMRGVIRPCRWLKTVSGDVPVPLPASTPGASPSTSAGIHPS
jgi:hypothetical protein